MSNERENDCCRRSIAERKMRERGGGERIMKSSTRECVHSAVSRSLSFLLQCRMLFEILLKQNAFDTGQMKRHREKE